MKYVFNEGFFKVARITGPAHNFLAISFNQSANEIVITGLNDKHGNESSLEDKSVMAQVMRGLTSINQELNTSYKIGQIQFVKSDTPSDTVYFDLTTELIRTLHSEQKI